ncbi:Tellurium resistance [Streptomyces sp. AV19]|uniref:Tellurium resistance n=1 Tax=Streptomyces sp. AV19 TaxID=2793068 RepID=UPI0018FE678F|nr:Tellurium resistance [Streptomyces sp. AV19]MBH1938315.1 Tellurium resistance [Streptomyces sp. AV19]MDG4534956.1 Tellurium resistance [Streptomyces sp. AV19]
MWEHRNGGKPRLAGIPAPAPPRETGGSLLDHVLRGRPRGISFDDPLHCRLTRGHPVVPLTEHGADAGTLRVNLTWQVPSGEPPPARPSLLPLRPRIPALWEQPQGPVMVTVDLDLACLYELADGSRGVVQPLGGLAGDLHGPPYVALGDDNRFGSASGETLFVNLDRTREFRRLLVFVYIYSGAPAFSRVHAAVGFHPPTGRGFVVELHERDPHARSCAVALIENRDGRLVLRREARYVYGYQADLDRLYGWGLQWVRGRKATD